MFADYATGAVAALDAEAVQVGEVFWQRAQRGGVVQSAVRAAGVVEVLVLAQDGHQVALVSRAFGQLAEVFGTYG
jgi:hypothetical protein